MDSITSLIKILAATDSRLFITKDEYISELAALVPFIIGKKNVVSQETYNARVSQDLKNIPLIGSIKLTNDFTSTDLDANTIAYHRVVGTITSDSRWRMSTKQLQRDMLSAESNSNISAHLLHVSSGGGEAWYLDQLAETIRSLEKPVHTFIERICGSAAYYIASQSDYISAATPFDVVGCIGTMTSFMDLQPMFEKWGVKFIEEYATDSDLKNKKYTDLMRGKPDQFIKEELDPMRDKFVEDVRLGRSSIAKLPEDHPVLRGETFYANKSIENGLIDTVEPFSAALTRVHDAGSAWSARNTNRKQALQIFNNHP